MGLSRIADTDNRSINPKLPIVRRQTADYSAGMVLIGWISMSQ